MADRKRALLISLLCGAVPAVVFLAKGMSQEFPEGEERKEALEALYQYMSFCVFLQVVVRAVGRYLLEAPDARGRPIRFPWFTLVVGVLSIVFFTFANFWGMKVLRKFQQAELRSELKDCKNMSRIAYTSSLYCYDAFPKHLNYYDIIEEVVVTYKSCLK